MGPKGGPTPSSPRIPGDPGAKACDATLNGAPDVLCYTAFPTKRHNSAFGGSERAQMRADSALSPRASGRGRPRLPPGEKRSVSVAFVVTPSEGEMLSSLASSWEVPVSTAVWAMVSDWLTSHEAGMSRGLSRRCADVAALVRIMLRDPERGAELRAVLRAELGAELSDAE